jgi:predicted lipopolysaccharide heptosyltransferase III
VLGFDLGRPRAILVNILLLQVKRIGDLILTTPVIAALREKFPGANLTLIVSRDGAPLLPAITGIERSLVVQRKWSDLEIFRTIFRDQFEYCIDFTGNDRSALLTCLSRAQKRIASNWIRVQSKRRGLAYNEFVPDRVGDMHTVDFHLSLIEPLGIRNVSPEVRLDLPRSAREAAGLLLRQAGIDNGFVIFHPGSARAEKFWDAQRWADVIEHARSVLKLKTVLTSGNSALEQRHVAEIKDRLSSVRGASPSETATGSIVDLSGQIDLLTLSALIEQAQMIVTVDSAPMHLAAATRTPQVVLFGPTNPFHWRPRESPALILQGRSTSPLVEFWPKQPRFSMNDISTEAVIDAMNALLSAPAAQAL